MNAHTPGPWVVKLLPGAGESHFRTEANARLIAAAPDMLAALQMAERRLAELNNSPTTVSFVRAAIAKAGGRL